MEPLVACCRHPTSRMVLELNITFLNVITIMNSANYCYVINESVHVFNRTIINTIMANLILFSLAVLVAVVAAQNQEQCHVYYGGLVFPEGSRRTVEHGLHWSKTQISKPAPDWNGTAVIKGEFKEMKLSDFKGKYLVFFFYPLDFTFVCPTEILAFSDRVGEFKAINTEVVACSVDSKYTHFAWINTPREEGGLKGLEIPLLSDLTKQISKDYGVLLENEGHTLRGLFIIDSKGILRQITMNDLPVGRSVDETLRLVQAFQYTDQKGEVCPAGWKPGEKTIKPDPVGKREYFEAAFCEDGHTKL